MPNGNPITTETGCQEAPAAARPEHVTATRRDRTATYSTEGLAGGESDVRGSGPTNL